MPATSSATSPMHAPHFAKPSSLVEILIRTSCPEGGLVGDFFAGSASAAEACAYAKRRYVGTEIDPAAFDAAQRRLGQLLFA